MGLGWEEAAGTGRLTQANIRISEARCPTGASGSLWGCTRPAAPVWGGVPRLRLGHGHRHSGYGRTRSPGAGEAVRTRAQTGAQEVH